MRTAAAVAAVLLTLVSAPAAHAERAVVRDPAGDVWPDLGGPGTRPVDRPDADARRVVLSHEASTFVVTARLASRPRRGLHALFVADLRTDTGVRASLSATSTGTRVDRLDYFSTQLGNECPDARLQVRPGRAQVRLEVPRSCLGDPRRVQARVATGGLTTTRTADVLYDVVGTAERNDVDVWSPRLRVG